jgi:hypothetical protein
VSVHAHTRVVARSALVVGALLAGASVLVVGHGQATAAADASRAAATSIAPLEAPPPAPDMLALQDALAQAIGSYWVPGKYAVAVTDLQTGESISVNGDQPQLSGCVVNLFALFQAVIDVWSGRYPQDVVDSLISATIWSSNAVTAHDLYGIIGNGDVVEGVRRVDHLIHDQLGLDAVVLEHPPAFGDSIGVSPDNWVSANAMNQALAALWHGEVVPEPSWRQYLLDHMTVVKPGLQYLTAAVPEVVSHKNGFLWASTGYVDNDVGIVRLQRGGTEYAYAFSFFSEGVTEEYADIPVGPQLAALAYQTMSARYPNRERKRGSGHMSPEPHLSIDASYASRLPRVWPPGAFGFSISPRQPPVSSPRASMNCLNRSRSPSTRRERKPIASPAVSTTPSGS